MITLFVNDGRECRSLSLEEAVVTIGRTAKNSVVIRSKRVSRQHALIRRHEAGYHLVDMGSGNGTLLNGQKVTSRELVKGDEIRIGTISISVIDLGLPKEPSTPVALESGTKPTPPAPPAPVATQEKPSTGTERILRWERRRRIDEWWERLSGLFIAVILCGLLLGIRAIGNAQASSPPSPGKTPRRAPPKSSVVLRSAEESALDALRVKVSKTDRVSDDLLAEAVVLADRYRDASSTARSPFDEIVDELRHRKSSETAEGLLDKVAERAEAATREGRYADALRALKLLANPEPMQEKIVQAMEKDLGEIEAEGRRLEQQGKFLPATEHYQAHAARFEGTRYHDVLIDRRDAARAAQQR